MQEGDGNKRTQKTYQVDHALFKKGHELISSAILFLRCAQ